jgi:flavin-dependent dehydrogenase
MGLWERLADDGHLPSHGNRSHWGTPTPIERDFLFSVHGSGWHLDRQRFEALLAEQARAHGVDWCYGHRLQKCRRYLGVWELTVKTPLGVQTLEADFLVDATGRAARVARALGVRRMRSDRLVGVTATLAAGRPGTSDSFTVVEAVPSGWWYSAPVPGGGLTVAFMTDSDALSRLGVRSLEGWYASVRQTGPTWSRIAAGSYRLATPVRIASADTSRLDSVAGKGWLAVGDAAAAYDPLSSYGICSALGTGFQAAEALAGMAAGRTSALAEYISLLDQVYDGYRAGWREHYAAERRWPGEAFWSRRQGDVPMIGVEYRSIRQGANPTQLHDPAAKQGAPPNAHTSFRGSGHRQRPGAVEDDLCLPHAPQ